MVLSADPEANLSFSSKQRVLTPPLCSDNIFSFEPSLLYIRIFPSSLPIIIFSSFVSRISFILLFFPVISSSFIDLNNFIGLFLLKYEYYIFSLLLISFFFILFINLFITFRTSVSNSELKFISANSL